MEINKVKKYKGKKVHLILANGFKYTTVLPKEITEDFTIVDKFDNEIEISCNFISFIQIYRENGKF